MKKILFVFLFIFILYSNACADRIYLSDSFERFLDKFNQNLYNSESFAFSFNEKFEVKYVFSSFSEDFRFTYWFKCREKRENINPVPEPSTLLLLTSGLVGLFFYRKNKNNGK